MMQLENQLSGDTKRQHLDLMRRLEERRQKRLARAGEELEEAQTQHQAQCDELAQVEQ